VTQKKAIIEGYAHLSHRSLRRVAVAERARSRSRSRESYEGYEGYEGYKSYEGYAERTPREREREKCVCE
jgi:hypothetical protein